MDDRRILESQNNRLKSEADAKVHELQLIIEHRNKEISDMKSRIAEIKTQSKEQGTSILQQQLENEKTKDVISELNEENTKQREKIVELKQRIQSQKLEIKDLQESKSKLEIEIRSGKDDLARSQQRERAERSEVEGKELELEDARAVVRKVLGMPPGFQDVESIIKFVDESQKTNERLQQEVIKACSIIKKLKAKQPIWQDQIDELKRNLFEAESRANAREQEIKLLKEQIIDLKKTINHQRARLEVIPGLEKTNIVLTQQLGEINAAVRECGTGPPLKSLIVFSIMILRWKSLVGTEKIFLKDSRNWWWLGSGKTDQVTGAEIKKRITGLTEKLEKASEAVKSQEETLHSALAELEEKRNLYEDIKEKYEREQETTVMLKTKTELLQMDLAVRVDRT